ncbi:MAG: tetratricopeptide repeat protein [Cyanobacteriota bacterium]
MIKFMFGGSFFKKLDEMFPNHQKLGDDLLKKKKYKEAIEHYEKALAIQQMNPYLHYNWATCLFALGRYKESLPHFRRAVQLNPNFADALCHWGIALIHINQPHQALSKFVKASYADPNDPKIYFHWGLLFEQLNKIEQAFEKYQKVLELTPVEQEDGKPKVNKFRIMALNQLAMNDLNQQKYQEALNKYKEIVSLAPEFPPALYNLAISYARLFQPDQAAKSLKLAIDQDLKAAKRARIEPAFKNILSHPELKSYFPDQQK